MTFAAQEIKFDVKKQRIYVLDEIRGTAIVCMVIFHMLYTVGYVFGNSAAVSAFNFFLPLEPVFAGLFIFISGICTRLSRSNLRRGAILFIIAIGVNIITAVFMPELVIKFGVLNLLSVCMLLYGLFGDMLKKLPAVWGLAVNAALFVLTWGINYGFIGILGLPLFEFPKFLYSTEYLYFLGFKSEGFYSADYFPIFPWIFAFMAGAYFSEIIIKRNLPKFFYKRHIAPLCTVGKHSLIIYLLHQPLIFGGAYIIYGLL